jgi:hypothetical protein
MDRADLNHWRFKGLRSGNATDYLGRSWPSAVLESHQRDRSLSGEAAFSRAVRPKGHGTHLQIPNICASSPASQSACLAVATSSNLLQPIRTLSDTNIPSLFTGGNPKDNCFFHGKNHPVQAYLQYTGLCNETRSVRQASQPYKPVQKSGSAATYKLLKLVPRCVRSESCGTRWSG